MHRIEKIPNGLPIIARKNGIGVHIQLFPNNISLRHAEPNVIMAMIRKYSDFQLPYLSCCHFILIITVIILHHEFMLIIVKIMVMSITVVVMMNIAFRQVQALCTK